MPAAPRLALTLLAGGCHLPVYTDGATTSTSAASTSTTAAPTTGDAPDLGAAACPHDDPDALMTCVDLERYRGDLEFIADVRDPGSPHWLAVQERCADELTAAGFTVELQDYGTGVNVVGTRPGLGPGADEIVLLGAHYDHIPKCPGADDNASGVAGLLELARVLGAAEFERTLVLACWDEEELGLRGSQAYAAAPAGDIVVAYTFDMIGYASDAPGSQFFPVPLADRFPDLAAELDAHDHRADFVALVADDAAAPFALDLEARAESIGRTAGVLALTAAEKLDADYDLLAASDHRSFWARDIPALLVFDTGVFRNSAYHCSAGLDTVDRLDHAFTADVLRATVASLAAAARLAG